MYTFEISTISDLLHKLKKYTVKGILGQIRCSCLVMEAESDFFFESQPQHVYYELQTPKKLIKFISLEGPRIIVNLARWLTKTR
jgi:hypothetical protein